jgi:clan AA aspartic protease
MGLTRAYITLVNATDIGMSEAGLLPHKQVRKAKIRTLVDSGAEMLVINEHIQKKLGLHTNDTWPVELANGSKEEYPVARGVRVYFENRNTTCDAIVMPGKTEPLLGAIPMEGMDVVVDMRKKELIVNPKHPNKKLVMLK